MSCYLLEGITIRIFISPLDLERKRRIRKENCDKDRHTDDRTYGEKKREPN